MVVDKKKEHAPAQREMLNIRIALTSRNVEALEKVCRDIVNQSNQFIRKSISSRKGPIRLPTRHLAITTRKSPCGNGTNTYDHWQMRVHKRYFQIKTDVETVKRITSKLDIEAGVSIEVYLVE
ncbi:ribosomal protein S10, eukaryotic/archaeal [Kipferlia bialata]|uniref:Small ribosomal subunit protein uS10 n=1 Tax=Kipferlia bialata TaxID=797122 RepID=A0A9K3CWD0_9EUKA|nr:ribosomal protein S10, eukaryotic/archaeal [Kipferlia bialata]|eukprot:g4980.t1